LESNKHIDIVIPFGSRQELENLIQLYSPDILLVGGDWRNGDVVGRQFAKEVRFLDRVGGYSTTDIIRRIHEIRC
jgi:D-beta-D-heptose 7-phosphate kinase/D-beta-D-heptose 1-phosphate adenosyltransferase